MLTTGKLITDNRKLNTPTALKENIDNPKGRY